MTTPRYQPEPTPGPRSPAAAVPFPSAPAPVPLAVNALDAAAICGVSRSHWLKLHAQGAVPDPIRLGRRVLWRTAELRDWLHAGCPSAPRWRWRAVRGQSP